MDRVARVAPVVVALLLVLAGCAAPISDDLGVPGNGESNTATGGPSDGDGDASVNASSLGPAIDGPGPAPATGDGDGEAPATQQADPDGDVLGWEDGYWYNDPVDAEAGTELNDTQLQAVLARAMARVEYVRGLEFEQSVDVSVVRRAEFDASELGGEEPSDSLRTFDNAKFQALFLVGGNEDSLDTQDQALNASVGGYYSGEQDAIVLVSEGERAVLDSEQTLAHELVHALQDQHFAEVDQPPRLRDAYNGRNGLFEGDASMAERLYTNRCGEQWRCLSASGEETSQSQQDSGMNMGVYFLEYFPYAEGPNMIGALGADGGWAAIDGAYDRIPTSATEVLFPDRYGEFEPRSIELPGNAGGGWERLRPPERPDYARLGQSALAATFAYTLYDGYNDTSGSSVVEASEFLNSGLFGLDRSDPLNYDLPPVRGWTGDRFQAYERDGEIAYVWRLTWESTDDASRFAGAYRDLLSHWGGERVENTTWQIGADSPFTGSYDVEVDGDTVTVTKAPTESGLDEVYPGAR